MGNSNISHNNPICIAGIDHVVIRILDLPAMLNFYCGVLGCVVERRQDDIGLIQLRAGNALIDLVPVAGKLGARADPHLTWRAKIWITSACDSSDSMRTPLQVF